MKNFPVSETLLTGIVRVSGTLWHRKRDADTPSAQLCTSKARIQPQDWEGFSSEPFVLTSSSPMT